MGSLRRWKIKDWGRDFQETSVLKIMLSSCHITMIIQCMCSTIALMNEWFISLSVVSRGGTGCKQSLCLCCFCWVLQFFHSLLNSSSLWLVHPTKPNASCVILHKKRFFFFLFMVKWPPRLPQSCWFYFYHNNRMHKGFFDRWNLTITHYWESWFFSIWIIYFWCEKRHLTRIHQAFCKCTEHCFPPHAKMLR